MNLKNYCLAILFLSAVLTLNAAAQTTEFTYQGRLLDNNLPPTAAYDFEFRLFNAETGGAALGTLQRSGVSVSNGIFTVLLDFGAQFDGAARWLEIAVRPAGGGTFTNLAPRQPITSAPYAIRGSTAANSLLLGGIAPSGFIQNTTSPQTANFNVSGNGTIGGDLNNAGAFNANILNANTQYNLGGSRILGAAGNQNLFAGINAGTSNTTGFGNAFIGAGAEIGGGNLSFATAIGADAVVSQTDSVVLGRLTANVGIGLSAPQQRLHIRDNSGNILFGNGGCNPGFAAIGFSTTLTCTNYSLLGDGSNTIINRPSGGVIAFREGNTDQMTINASGIVSINTLAASGNTPLCRNASFNIAVCSSSLRYKENVQSFAGGLEIVRRLRPVTFNWKEGGMFDVGFAAEEVSEVEPLLATRNDKGEIEGVKYAQITTVLVNAVKEQQTQIEAQAAHISAQQKQIQQQTLIDALKNLVCRQNPQVEICKQ